MKKYQILIISLSVLFLMMGVVCAEGDHPITTVINGLSVSDENTIDIKLDNVSNNDVNINGDGNSFRSSSIKISVSLPIETSSISVSNYHGATVNLKKVNAATGSSFHTDINDNFGYFTVTLKDSNGNVIKNKQVTVKINGNSYITTTDDSGEIIISVQTDASSADISYSGTSKQVPVNNNGNTNTNTNPNTNTNTNTKTVKVASKIKAATKSFKAKTKTKKYTIVLKDKNNKPIKNQKVTLKINNKIYSAKTNAKGTATFKLTKLTKKGKYSAVIKFKGNKNYKPITRKVVIVVK